MDMIKLLIVFISIVFVSVFLTHEIETQTDINYTMFLSIIVILFTFFAIHFQVTQSHKQEEIRHIEKSLENFYLPLHNMFIGYQRNPIDRYQEQKTKFLEIGCYKHLAEPETRECFEKDQQDNESLGKLICKVNGDINLLQNKYKEKTKDKGLFS